MRSKLEKGFGKDHSHREIEGFNIIAGKEWLDSFDEALGELHLIGKESLTQKRLKRRKRNGK